MTVSRHESDIGRWEMVSRPAAPALRAHVLGYCGYEERTRGFNVRRELPSGEVVMILGFGPAIGMRSGGRLESHRSFVAGLSDGPCLVETPGTQAGIQVNLTPIGVHLLLGLPMRELTNRAAAIEDLLGGELVEQLYEAPGWEARFALLDRALERRLDAARPASPDVAWAWGRLRQSGGRLRVAELCEEIGCSRRHMLRRFDEQVGVPPKTYARLLRFQTAVRLLGHRDGRHWGGDGAAAELTWGRIALECGYFDQAHMNRDFRRFAGMSPGALAASLLPDGGGLPG
jgi:AraC-like DNA-binding protein